METMKNWQRAMEFLMKNRIDINDLSSAYTWSHANLKTFRLIMREYLLCS